MCEYVVTFTNCAPVVVFATNRQDAIKQAINQTRGYLSATAQRLNLLSAKQVK